jgi:hypothetical protein
MEEVGGGNATFLIKVLGRQHATWQGTVTIPEEESAGAAKLPGKSRGRDVSRAMFNDRDALDFQSLLELIHLIDDALEKNKE